FHVTGVQTCALPIFDDSARMLLEKYRWPGNVRQLKNITEQISVIEKNRLLSADDLRKYLPSHAGEHLPAVFASESRGDQSFSSRSEERRVGKESRGK